MTSVVRTPIEAIGRWLMRQASDWRSFAQFMREVVRWTFRKPFRGGLLLQQLEFIGNQSLNILLVSGFAVGAVFGLQIGAIFLVFRAESLMGGATGAALCR